MTDPGARRASTSRPTADEMLAAIADGGEPRRARPAPRLPRDGARRRQDVPDARGGPSPDARAGRTWSSASSRRTGGPRPRSSSTASRSCPRRRIEYRGVVVEEMDTDAILARRPTVALVDELAHTNAPGSARAKRWEDVEVMPRCGHRRREHMQHPASRIGRRRRRDDHRRAGQRAACRTRSSPPPTRSSSST